MSNSDPTFAVTSKTSVYISMIRSKLETSLILRRKSHSQVFIGGITNGLKIRL